VVAVVELRSTGVDETEVSLMYEAGCIERSLVDGFSKPLMRERAKLRVYDWNELASPL
jgi:hypothetical protein